MRQAIIVGGNKDTASENLPDILKHGVPRPYDEVCQLLLGSSAAEVQDHIDPRADTTDVFVFDAGEGAEDVRRQLNAKGITAYLFKGRDDIWRLTRERPTGVR